MRKCPEDAEQMDIGRHKAYCRRCSQRVTGIIPCSGTSVELCPHKWGLDKGYRGTRCPTCAAFEVETTP